MLQEILHGFVDFELPFQSTIFVSKNYNMGLIKYMKINSIIYLGYVSGASFRKNGEFMKVS